MAVVNLSDIHYRFVVIRANGEGVPISFPLGNNELVVVEFLRLSFWFWLSEDSMHIDEEVLNAITENPIHTI